MNQSKTRRPDNLDRIFASADTIQHLLDYGRDAIVEWESQGKITEGIHFIRIGAHRRYVIELMLDRLVNWNDDQAHQKAIQNWLLRLPSNQPSPKVRKGGARMVCS